MTVPIKKSLVMEYLLNQQANLLRLKITLRCSNVHGKICNSCNMGMRDLPDMYARSPRAAGLRPEGIHIRQIMNAHVTSVMYNFVAIVTTPVV